MPRKTKAKGGGIPKVAGGKVKTTDKFEHTHYASLFVGNIAPEEFYLQVGNLTGPGEADIHWRFATSLNGAKRLHAMLGKILARHEETWGPIPLTKEPIKPPKKTAKRKKASRKKAAKRKRK